MILATKNPAYDHKHRSDFYVVNTQCAVFLFSESDSGFILFPKAFQLSFMIAQPFLTVCAGKAGICAVRKPLGMSEHRQFPADEDQN